MHSDPSDHSESHLSALPTDPSPGVMQLPRGNASAQARSSAAIADQSAPLLTLGERGLQLPLGAGPTYFNYYWLRDFCPSTIDPQTRERVFDITEMDAAPYPHSASITDDCLHIQWQHEAHQTTLPLASLEPYAHAGGRKPDAAALPRQLWTSGHYPSIQRIPLADIHASDESRMCFARALIDEGIALVTDMDNSDEALTRLAETLGPITPTVDGSYFDVRLTIDPTNLAYTANALELHTDLPNEETAPGVQFLHCRANSVEGGRSLFVDGAAVAEALRVEHPEEFALLCSHEIPFFRRHDGWDYRAYQRVIELDHAGNVSGLTISQHLQDTLDLPQDVLDVFYPALCLLIRLLKEERFMNRFRLSGGECIVFDNHRVIHGREAFVANSGERHLRGCYVDRGALRSTYRTLVAQGLNK